MSLLSYNHSEDSLLSTLSLPLAVKDLCHQPQAQQFREINLKVNSLSQERGFFLLILEFRSQKEKNEESSPEFV